MKSKSSTYIIFVGVVILLVIGLGVFASRSQNAPSKYTAFAQALKDNGTAMYGAFWCPHCADQEKEFGISRQNLETIGLYNECSNPDRSPTKICTDKKIESFPTWTFKNGISLTSTATPITCAINPDKDTLAKEDKVCEQISSAYFKVYYFPNYEFSIRTDSDPIHKGNVWQFPVTASTAGLVPLTFLAQQIGYTLPQ